MGEAKRRKMAGLPPSRLCSVGEVRVRRGVFTLPSGKTMTITVPESLSIDDADVAATALARLSLELATKAGWKKTDDGWSNSDG